MSSKQYLVFSIMNTKYKSYEILEHTADLKIRTYGKNPAELFSNMLKGMFESTHPEIIKGKLVIRKIQIKSSNLESLLVDFLSEALYLSDVRKETYLEVEFEILTEGELIGTLRGQKIKNLQTEIKAVTWHDLEVKKEKNQWQATVLFDI